MKSDRSSDFFDPSEIESPYDIESPDKRHSDEPEEQEETGRKRRSKSASKPVKQAQQPSSALSLVRDRRTHIFFGILLVGLALYLFGCAISYFSGGEADQSAVMNLSVTEMASGAEIHNAGGAVGAAFSHNFISNGFGLGTLVIIAYLFILGSRLLNRRKFNFIGLTFRSLVLTITTSVVAGLVTLNMKSWLYWGGIHGYELNTYLLKLIGLTGTVIVSGCLIGLVVAIYFNELRLHYLRYRRRSIARAQRREARRAEKEARRNAASEGLQESDATLQPQESLGDEPDSYIPTTPLRQQVSFSIGFLGDNVSDTAVDHQKEPDESNETSETDMLFSDTEPIEPDDTFTDEPVVSEEPVSQPTTESPGLTVTVNEVEAADYIDSEIYDPTASLSRYVAPSIDILSDSELKGTTVDQDEVEENKQRIIETLGKYGIPIVHIEATVGPTITLFEIKPDDGVRIAKVKRLEDDIAMQLAAKGIRIIAPIPGKSTIGIEVPNKERQIVPARTVFGSKKFKECSDMELPLAMGATISRDIFIADLAKMPHLLVAGATGTGKSVGLNIILASLMFKKHPSQLKFVLVDPKEVEFSLYAKLEHHFLAKLPDEEDAIVTEPAKAAATLNSLCTEMDNRYKLLKKAGVRNIKEYNEKFIHHRLLPSDGHDYMPYIVTIVDEFGDIFMQVGKDIEVPIARIAQKARAVGIHLILATQRPSTDIIKGFIRANFPARMAFQVASRVESQVILDRIGAQALIGKGDMLCSRTGELERVQCAFISTEEVETMVESIAAQPGFETAYLLPEYNPNGDTPAENMFGNVTSRDALFAEAARFIVQGGSSTTSTSLLQRRFSIGYNRAGKLMDQMEQAGIVGPSLGQKPRSVLMTPEELERFLEIPLVN